MNVFNTSDGGSLVLACSTLDQPPLEWTPFRLSRFAANGTLLWSQTPADRDVHLIVDNYATHKHAGVEAWLKKQPRFKAHCTPTSASWLNMVKRFFRDLTVRRVRAGVFRSLAELELAITDYIRGEVSEVLCLGRVHAVTVSPSPQAGR